MSIGSAATPRRRWSNGRAVQPLVKIPQPDDVTAARIRANLLTFGRDLRRAGLNIGSGQILNFVEAVGQIDVKRRVDFYHASKATLVTMPEQIPFFDAEFAKFWRRVMNPVPPIEQEAGQENFDMPPPPGSDSSDSQENSGDPNSKQQRAKDRAILAVEDSASEESQGDEVESPPEDVLVF